LTTLIIVACVVLVLAIVFGIRALTSGGGLFAPPATPTPIATQTPLPTPTVAGLTPDVDLASVIANAAEGDTITLAAGIFALPTGFTLDKSLTIIGAGHTQTILTAAAPTADATVMVNFSGSGTFRLQGLTLSYIGSDPAANLLVNSGNLEMTDCLLQGATLSSSGKHMGAIQIANDAKVTISDSIIAGNKAGAPSEKPDYIPGGILLSGTSQLVLENSQITDSYLGVYAHGNSTVTVRNNTFTNNYSSITLLENAIGTIEGNTVNANKTDISLFDDSQASITGNTFAGGEGALGVNAAGNSHSTIRGNQFTGMLGGISYGESATGLAEKNDISGFSNVGITLMKTSSPELSENTISNAQTMAGVGISLGDDSTGNVHNNTLSSLDVCIGVADQAIPTITENTLTDCYRAGINFAGESAGIVKGNTVSSAAYALIIGSPAHPEITGNTFWGMEAGILSDPVSWVDQLTMSDNQITSGPPEVIVVTYTPTP
jgi:parallel beta-helix repeat protein